MQFVQVIHQLALLELEGGKKLWFDLAEGTVKWGKTILVDKGQPKTTTIETPQQTFQWEVTPVTADNVLAKLEELYEQYYYSLPDNKKRAIPALTLDDMTPEQLNGAIDRRLAWALYAGSIIQLRMAGWWQVDGFFYRGKKHYTMILLKDWFRKGD